MTLTKYRRTLNRLLPIKGDEEFGRTRFSVAKKCGYDPYHVMKSLKCYDDEIKSNIYRTMYLEFIRYNKDKILFYML